MAFKPLKIALTGLLFSVSAISNATIIEFTGGDVHRNDGSVEVTNNNMSFDNVARYEEQGFKFEFFFDGAPTPFASTLGDYYNTGNDVVHWHWSDGPFGEVNEVRVSRIDGALFDLGGFAVSTNTSTGGAPASGTERVSVNTDKGASIFNIASDDWGLGNGADPIITLDPTNMFFQDIAWFSFTNDAASTAVGMGLDNFFLNEAGDPNGIDPTNIPEPSTIAILGLGLLGLVSRKAIKK